MFDDYFIAKMFLFFAIIAFSKIDRMRTFVMKMFFQTFDASNANERAKISRHRCKARRKIFDIVRFFKNKINHDEKISQKNRYEYKILQNNWQNEILTQKFDKKKTEKIKDFL